MDCDLKEGIYRVVVCSRWYCMCRLCHRTVHVGRYWMGRGCMMGVYILYRSYCIMQGWFGALARMTRMHSDEMKLLLAQRVAMDGMGCASKQASKHVVDPDGETVSWMWY